MTESAAKQQLAKFGLSILQTKEINHKTYIEQAATAFVYSLVLKTLGIAHKSESGAVILGIDSNESLRAAIEKIPESNDGYLLKQMVNLALAKIIIGVSLDTSGMLLLTLGAGGILTELLNDSASLVMPVTRSEVKDAISSIKINSVLQGYRGSPAVNITTVVEAVMSVQNCVEANIDLIVELDINPLIVREHDSVAVDALIRKFT